MALQLGPTAAPSAVPPGWYNVKAYGAVGDNTTDDTAAIQAAINALKATTNAVAGNSGGQTLYFPQGFYKITSTLDLSGVSGVRILGAGGKAGYGAGGGANGTNPACCINFTAGGSGTVVDMRMSQGCVWDGVSIWANPGSFSGILLNLDTNPSGDVVGHRVQNCQLAAPSGSSAILLALAANICTSVDNVLFSSAGSSGSQVRMVNPSATSKWSNANSFKSCFFVGTRANSILNPGPQTTLVDCTFEPSGGIPAPINYNQLGNEPAELLTLIGCGFWDNTAATNPAGSWILSSVATRQFAFTGCRFGINPNGTAIKLSSHNGLSINACRFGTEGTGTPNVFDPTSTITNSSWVASQATGGAVDNHSTVWT